jgi:type VI secretion system protein ImpE
MTPHEAFVAGRLAEAVELQEALVRENPGEVSPRVALIELLLFTGELDDVRTHLAIVDSDDPAWPDAARTFKQIIRAERRRSHRVRRPIVVPEPPADHAKARWMAVRSLRDGDPVRAMKWIDRADARSPVLRGFLDGREFHEIRDVDDRFASVLEAFVDGRYVWFPWEAVSRVKLEPAKYAMDRFARFANVRLKDGGEFGAYLPLIYPGSHEADGAFAVGLETDLIGDDDGPVRALGGKELIVDDDEIALGDVTMIELR